MPSAPPMTRPISGAQSPTTSEMRAPWINRASSSRPSPSVPSQCSAETGARRSSMSISVGLGSGRMSARIATAKTRPIQPIAIQNKSPSRLGRRAGVAATSSWSASSSVAMANPRIENGVEQIDDEVHHHEAHGDHQHRSLQDDQIAGVDRTDQKPADSRQRKDRLDDQRAADQSADIDAGDRDQRQRGWL